MFKSNKRSVRRHHNERLKKRAQYVFTKIWSWNKNATWAKWAISRRWDSMKGCSCIQCRNPRNAWGKNSLTLPEIRNLYTLKEEVDSFLCGEDTINLSENNNEIQSYI